MGRAIHPYTAVPGGIAHQVTEEMVNEIKELGRNSMEIVEVIVDAVRKVTMDLVENKKDLLDKLGNIETGYLGVVKDDGTTDFYDGKIRYMSKDGKITDFEAKDYLNYIAETTMDWSYVKAPYWKEFGFPAGIMKVGPLARLNVIEKLGTPKADELLKEYREIVGRPAHITMLYHYARAIELMNCTEKALELLDDSDITGKDRFADVPEPGAGEGIAIIEAQRGTLLHHYKTDENGFLSDCSMIVSTTFNNPAIDQSIKIAAKNLINSSSADEKILNTIEMVQRAYDPCLSCAAHSLDGRFPTVVEILDSEGNRIREIKNF
ncbi:MAG TPA: hypothetical protein EYP86_00715 [Candidatus Altiarchaeales archaeon]|nr:hypothetical protein [Candidatus Altiarchaeales archaeon]